MKGKPAPNQDNANQLSARRTRGNLAGTLALYGQLWMQFTDRRRTAPPFQGQMKRKGVVFAYDGSGFL
jgi:hypothetical protein